MGSIYCSARPASSFSKTGACFLQSPPTRWKIGVACVYKASLAQLQVLWSEYRSKALQ